MKLNRYNYEEFFILYLDNELDGETRREVDDFVQANPDLKAELDVLAQSRLIPDTEITFVDKGSLLRFDNSSISLSNYEEKLISYIDNELNEGERNEVERFAAAHPAVQKELNLLRQTKLQPEAIVFPNRESLYRKEEKARIISFRWMRIAAAAVLLLAVGTTAIILLNNNNATHSGGPVVVVDPTGSAQQKSGSTPKEVVTPPSNKHEIASTGSEAGNTTTLNKHSIARAQENTQIEKHEQEKVEKDDRLIATVNVQPNGNDLPTPVQTPDLLPNNSRLTGGVDQSLATNKEKTEVPTVTSGTSNPYNNTEAAVKKDDNPDAQFASENSGNKGLRGFLRKVTRTFEKRTNIKATDDDRLLIAGLAIKMN